jgi:NitT/TauT family transport system permease protein
MQIERTIFIRFIVMGSLVVLWQVLVWASHVSPYLLPSPADVLSVGIQLFPDTILPKGLQTTLGAGVGFLSATVVALTLAILVDFGRKIGAVVDQLLLTTQILPKVALAPILLPALGMGTLARTSVVFIMSLFPLYNSARTGLRRLDDEIAIQGNVIGISRVRFLFGVRLRMASPYLAAGARQAILLAVVGEIVAEYITCDGGLGYSILRYGQLDEITETLACVIGIFFIGAGMYFVVDALGDRLVKRLHMEVIRA